MKNAAFVAFFLLITGLYPVHSQDHQEELPRKRIALYIGHTLIPSLSSDQRFLIPSYGLDLDYWLTPGFGLGLHGDIEIETFFIKRSEGEELERLYPIVLSLDGLWNPYKGLIIQAGPGVEVDPGKKFLLVRAGFEYEIQISNHWDVTPTLFYDHRFGNFDTWTLALGIGKRF